MENKKITAKYLIKEILDVLEFKRGAPRTFFKIFKNPSEVINSYLSLSHRDNGFIGPLRMLYIISFICVLINESLKPYIDYKSIPLPELPYKTIHNGLEGFVYEHYFDYDDFLGQWIQMEEEIYHKWKGTDDFQKYEKENHKMQVNYWEKNISEDARKKYYDMLEFLDAIQMTINPFYYAIPIAFIVSCATFLIFFHTKKSFIEHFIINFYPIGIIFLCFGFFGVTQNSYNWLRPIIDPQVGGISHRMSFLSFIFFGLERFYIVYYYLKIFGREKIVILKNRGYLWEIIIISICILFYPTFDFSFWGSGWAHWEGTKPYIGIDLYNIAILNWKYFIFYLNETFYYKIAYWFVA